MAAERQVIEWIIRPLGLKPAGALLASVDRILTDNQRALELIRASPWESEYPKEGLSLQLERLTEAVTLDSNFAQAHVLLAAITGRLCDRQFRPGQVMAAMRLAASDALRLDDTLSLAHQELGYVVGFFERDWEGGEAHFKRAIEFSPHDYWSHWSYAKFLRTVGRLPEAKGETEQAYDFTGRKHYAILAEQLYAEPRFDEAASLVDPKPAGAANFYDGDLLFAAGRLPESIAALERTRTWDDSPEWISRLGFVHARMGNQTKAREALQDLERLSAAHPYVSPYFIAVLHAGLGQTNECFGALDRAVNDRSRFVAGWGLYSLMTDVAWDSVRGDPRFLVVVERARFTAEARELALRRKLPR